MTVKTGLSNCCWLHCVRWKSRSRWNGRNKRPSMKRIRQCCSLYSARSLDLFFCLKRLPCAALTPFAFCLRYLARLYFLPMSLSAVHYHAPICPVLSMRANYNSVWVYLHREVRWGRYGRLLHQNHHQADGYQECQNRSLLFAPNPRGFILPVERGAALWSSTGTTLGFWSLSPSCGLNGSLDSRGKRITGTLETLSWLKLPDFSDFLASLILPERLFWSRTFSGDCTLSDLLPIS
jgi:hypothetical protein